MHSCAEWITLAEIALRYRREWGGVVKMSQRPPWRENVRRRRRGMRREHHAADVDHVIRTWLWVPPTNTDFDHDELLTVRQIADYSGYGFHVVRLDALHSDRDYYLGPPDKSAGGVKWWRRDTVDDRYLGRMAYQRHTRKPTPE